MPKRWDEIVENVVDMYKEKKVEMKEIKVSIYADERNVIRWQKVADTHKENQLIERKYQNQRLFWWHGIENVWSDLCKEKQVWTSPRTTKNMIVKVAAKNSYIWWCHHWWKFTKSLLIAQTQQHQSQLREVERFRAAHRHIVSTFWNQYVRNAPL